jgi:hypothetical protein
VTARDENYPSSEGPKTKRGIRTIQIDSGLCELLRREREKHLRLVAVLPDDAIADVSLIGLPKGALCFPAMGTDLTALRSPDSLYQMFNKRAREIGFNIRFLDLRGAHGRTHRPHVQGVFSSRSAQASSHGRPVFIGVSGQKSGLSAVGRCASFSEK